MLWSNLVKMLDACPNRFLVFVFHYVLIFLLGNVCGEKNTIINPILACYQYFCFASQSCQTKINLWHMRMGLFCCIFLLESPSAIGVDRALCIYLRGDVTSLAYPFSI